jgi:hypothetical protein
MITQTIQQRYYERHRYEPKYLARKKKDRRNYYVRHGSSVRAATHAWKTQNPNKVAQQRRREYDINSPNHRFNIVSSAARYRGHAWALSRSEYAKLANQPCSYCGSPLPRRGSGLDRINNSKSYTVDNVVPCCGDCNRIKCHLLTFDEMRVAMEAIKKLRLNKILGG